MFGGGWNKMIGQLVLNGVIAGSIYALVVLGFYQFLAVGFLQLDEGSML